MGAAEYFETGDYRAAQAAFARALEISSAERDAGLELRTLAYATSVDHFDLRWSEVLAKSRRIRELARRVDDPRSETYARYRDAFALMQTGHADEGTLASDANLALAEQLKDRGLLADALYVKSALAQLKGEWREARAYSDRALALSAHQVPFLQTRLLLESETGNRKAGEAYLERLLAGEESQNIVVREGERARVRSGGKQTLGEAVSRRVCGQGRANAHHGTERGRNRLG